MNRIAAVARYIAGERGAAAAEFALLLPLLSIPILNVIDFGIYAWDKMQLDNAAQVAAQAAWATCGTASSLPALTNCTGLTNAVNAAVITSSLGNRVSVTGTAEGFYCVNTAGKLVSVASSTSCSAVNKNSGDTPGDYILVTAQYTYAPLFAAVAVATLLPAQITRVAWMRLA